MVLSVSLTQSKMTGIERVRGGEEKRIIRHCTGVGRRRREGKSRINHLCLSVCMLCMYSNSGRQSVSVMLWVLHTTAEAGEVCHVSHSRTHSKIGVFNSVYEWG